MLTKDLESYLSIRRTAGFEMKEPENILRHFVRYASEKGEDHIQTQTAVDWASMALSFGHKRHKLHTLIRFAQHAKTDDDQHEIPPRDLFGSRPKRRIPHIYSNDEISSLLLEASKMGPAGSLRPHTYTTLFGLLASTGIRISEALSLTLNDISREGLAVRQTKFKKSRFIPIHKTVFDQMACYIINRQRFALDDDLLFISIYKNGLCYGTVCEVFRYLRKKIGIDKGSARSRPRIHDLRHAFAVRSLEKCPEGRDRLQSERGTSQNTQNTYAYAFQLLFEFAANQLNKSPSSIFLENIDASMITAFLEYLEMDRKNSPVTRNAD